MTKKERMDTIQRAVDMGDCAYECFEHVTAVLNGMAAISQTADISDRVKIMQIEKSIKTALYLTHDGAALVDVETEALKETLNGD